MKIKCTQGAPKAGRQLAWRCVPECVCVSLCVFVLYLGSGARVPYSDSCLCIQTFESEAGELNANLDKD